MRYVTLPLMVFATAHSLYAQTGVYDVTPFELNGGYAIAEGGTISVKDGQIAAWDILVTGEYPIRFNSGIPGFDGLEISNLTNAFSITDDRITFTFDGMADGLQFSASDLSICSAYGVLAESCRANLGWWTVRLLDIDLMGLAEYDTVGYYVRATGLPGAGHVFNSEVLREAGEKLTVASRVPEPTCWNMVLMGLGILGAWRTRNHAEHTRRPNRS